MPQRGWDSVTVPGAVSAWVALSEKFGCLPFARLFERAIHYAEAGYQVGPKTAYYWKFAERTFADFDAFNQTFLRNGRAPTIGSRVQLPDHGKTLRQIMETHGETFYRGELADAMAKDCATKGGAMTVADLNNHHCDWVPLIEQSFGDATLHEIPPNGQGLIALIALGILNQLELPDTPNSDLTIHLQLEAMRIAYAEAERHLADIAAMTVTPAQLLSPAYLAERAASVSDQANPNPHATTASPDTVYLTTADASGMMVSMIQSNYRGFGAGIVVPGTGISLQNRGSGFTLEAGHPNQVAGGKRPFHTIIPGFVTEAGEPRMSFGVMGGHMQAQGHVQMMLRVFHYGENPQSASDAPRWHLREDGVVCLEDGFNVDVADALARRGHTIAWNNPEHLFGGAQLIYKLDDGYCAGSDHRKEGLATGF